MKYRFNDTKYPETIESYNPVRNVKSRFERHDFETRASKRHICKQRKDLVLTILEYSKY